MGLAGCGAVAHLGIRFDLRDPGVAGTAMVDRYAAALDMAAWADRLGFAFLTLSEHHGSPDGYLPSPLPIAAAVAARTDRIQIQIAAMVAAFHDPLRLAEDAAVVDLLSRGRLELVIANGYVADEFAMFDVPMGERAARTAEVVTTLRAAWTGEPFTFRGRTVRVTPRPHRERGPKLAMGGSSDAAARRAARLGVSFRPSTGTCWEAYRAERVERGGSDPGPFLGGDTTVTFVAADPDAAWAAIGPYALYEANAYGSWATAAGADTGYVSAADVDEVRAGGRYRILTPDELVADLTGQGDLAVALFHPLLGGLPPDLGWESLRLFEHEVLPQLG
jgi:alkanesulfonate monooxygenase SsuD/methylene tetrahydromethanopterin reductase-like flavin-dependent oxidoreductase (luciferase family)